MRGEGGGDKEVPWGEGRWARIVSGIGRERVGGGSGERGGERMGGKD